MLSGSELFRTLNFYIQGHEFCPVGEGKTLKDFKQRKYVKNEGKKFSILKNITIQQMVLKLSICKKKKKRKKNLGSYLTLYVKINSKWILDLYVNLLRNC